MKGKFIVVEGLDCSGKTTLCNTISRELQKYGVEDTLITREPGGTPLAERLRLLVKQDISGDTINNKAELLVLYAARVQLAETVIKPALSEGRWVVGDRHDLSSHAYQGEGRNLGHNFLSKLRDLVLDNFYPDLTIYLDITVEESLIRMYSRGGLDRIEKSSTQFFEKVRGCYLALAETRPSILTIDAMQSNDRVIEDTKIRLRHWIKKISYD